MARLVAVHAERLAIEIEDRFGSGDDAASHVLRRALCSLIVTHIKRGAMTIHNASAESLPGFAESIGEPAH